MNTTAPTRPAARHRHCVLLTAGPTAAAEAWRDDGELLATGITVLPRLAAGLAKLTTNPALMMTDAECFFVSEPVPLTSVLPDWQRCSPFRSAGLLPCHDRGSPPPHMRRQQRRARLPLRQ